MPNSPLALVLGMDLVAAMGVQNALGVLAYPEAPPSTVMTTNMTRLFVDLAARAARTQNDRRARDEIRRRMHALALPGAGFLTGCAVAAAGHVLIGLWVLSIPVACVALALGLGPPPAPTSDRRSTRQ